MIKRGPDPSPSQHDPRDYPARPASRSPRNTSVTRIAFRVLNVAYPGRGARGWLSPGERERETPQSWLRCSLHSPQASGGGSCPPGVLRYPTRRCTGSMSRITRARSTGQRSPTTTSSSPTSRRPRVATSLTPASRRTGRALRRLVCDARLRSLPRSGWRLRRDLGIACSGDVCAPAVPVRRV